MPATRSSSVPAPPTSAIVLDGKYALEERIGSGGFGTVWRGQHMQLRKPVAVKFCAARASADREAVRRILREARLAAAVRHRNVVDILDFGESPDHGPYLVMELLEGTSLHERIQAGPPLKLAEVLAIADGVLSGLAAVHRTGIVHRDIKPENIFLVAEHDGSIHPKLVDFGISRAVSPDDTLRSAVPTRDNVVPGTPQYMAPEQLRSQQVDARADVYTIGIVMFECLAGRLPFDATNIADLIKAITEGARTKLIDLRPDLEADICDVVERALSLAPDNRFASALEMRGAVLECGARLSGSNPVIVATGQRLTPSSPVNPPSQTIQMPITRTSRPPPSASGPVPVAAHAREPSRAPEAVSVSVSGPAPAPVPAAPHGIGHAKGAVFVNLRDYVAEHRGDHAWPRYVATLPPGDRAVLQDILLVGGQYPVAIWNRLLDVVLADHPNPDDGMRDIARFIADRDLNTIFKIVLKIGTPQFLMQRTTSIWQRYFDTGVVTAHQVAPRHWELTLTAGTQVHEAPGAYTCGPGVEAWLRHALELTRVRNPTIVHEHCRFRGSGACRFRVRW